MKACEWHCFSIASKCAKIRSSRGIAGLHEQSLRSISHPAIGMRQLLHALRCRLRHCSGLRTLFRVWHDAPDAALVEGLLQLARLDIGDQIMREEALVLDYAAIHVHQVERAIRSVCGLHWAEALIGGSEELIALGRVDGFDGAVLLNHLEALYQVGRRLGNEGIASIHRREGITAIDERATGGRWLSKGAVGTQRLRIITAIHAGCGVRGIERLILRELGIGAGRSAQQRIAGEGLRRQQIGAQHVGVVVEIEAAHIVLAKTPLAASQSAVLLPGTAAQLQPHAIARSPDGIVHRPDRRVRHVFGLTALGAKVARDDLLHIRFAITIGVFAEEEVRWLRDQRTTIHGHHRAWHHESIEKHTRLVHTTIAIGVLQQGHAARGLCLTAAFEVMHVATHLNHKEPALIIKAHRHGRLDHRLRSYELDAEAFLDLERFHRLLR